MGGQISITRVVIFLLFFLPIHKAMFEFMHMSMVSPRAGGRGAGRRIGIPAVFDISPSNFGQFFHP